MGNATWDKVSAEPNVSDNPFFHEMNGNGASASQAGSTNPFLKMMDTLEPVTAEEAKETLSIILMMKIRTRTTTTTLRHLPCPHFRRSPPKRSSQVT